LHPPRSPWTPPHDDSWYLDLFPKALVNIVHKSSPKPKKDCFEGIQNQSRMRYDVTCKPKNKSLWNHTVSGGGNFRLPYIKHSVYFKPRPLHHTPILSAAFLRINKINMQSPTSKATTDQPQAAIGMSAFLFPPLFHRTVVKMEPRDQRL